MFIVMSNVMLFYIISMLVHSFYLEDFIADIYNNVRTYYNHSYLKTDPYQIPT